MNVLYWIRGCSRSYKTFVANRVSEIHDHSEPVQWRYVPTEENPADLASRGTTVEKLVEEIKWWYGPSFLREPEQTWPKNKIEKSDSAQNEIKKGKTIPDIILVATFSPFQPETVIDPKRFSTWRKLLRANAWMFRFIENCKKAKSKRKSRQLSVDEINDSENHLLRQLQKEAFSDEIKALTNNQSVSRKNKLLPLQPRIDQNGILRCDGRLQFAEFLPYDTRYPIILPRGEWITKLIVKHYHEEGKHISGTNQTLASLSARFWIISAREEIRAWEKQCNDCKRRKAKAAEQIMAPLPEIRFKEPLRAFARCAVDYGGPFVTVQGRGKRREKHYLWLFTCLSTRAVHLEVAFGLDTDSFLNAFFRMVNRRGLPLEIMSDNGTNFIGANRELRDLVKQLDGDKTAQQTSNRGIKWHFNPPLAPHFGGVHETMIKAAKRAIHAILQKADVSDEELITAFMGAEALVNSRPLTFQSAYADDIVPLTPNHFLHATSTSKEETATSSSLSSRGQATTTVGKYLFILSTVIVPNIYLHIEQAVERVESLQWTIDHLSRYGIKSKKILVYCRTLRSCQTLYMWCMEDLGDKAFLSSEHLVKDRLVDMFHSKADQETVSRIMNDFPKEESVIRLLFSTVAFGLGVQIDSIDIVVHYGIESTTLSYWQEIGRCARDGRPGLAITYAFKRSVNDCDDANMKEVATSTNCIRSLLLRIFILQGSDSINFQQSECDMKCEFWCKCSYCLCCSNCHKNCKCPSKVRYVLERV
ncbi:hypothetical protein FSP39_015041 [Pinctada imbricata]|uniref:Uncharacterized protein n=1 Tax=Pinctada imbricata TaxID=66713 RepID=A0AA89C6V1_PINIB|nr:hypothetical protein FSP39_015041 [Pinctada imbricata]